MLAERGDGSQDGSPGGIGRAKHCLLSARSAALLPRVTGGLVAPPEGVPKIRGRVWDGAGKPRLLPP